MVPHEEQADGPGERAEAIEEGGKEWPLLSPVFALGADVSIRTPVHYLDGHRVLYAVGCQVALLDHEQHSMHFLPDLRGAKITCLALAYNRKYVAVVEKGAADEGAQISIYGNQGKWKRVRTITLTAEVCPSKDVTCLSFSSDNKYLVTVGGDPDWTLLYWRWASGKVVGSYKIGNAKDDPTVKRLYCNPWEHSTVAASGPKELRIFKLPKEESAVKVTQPTFVVKGEAPRFKGEITDHVWLEPESLAFSTDVGSVVIVSRDAVAATFETPNPCTITALARVGKGFLAADRRGRCNLFELVVSDSGKPSYVASSSYHALKDGQSIRSLRMSPLEEQAACALDSGNLAMLTVAGPSVADWAFSLLYRGFHQGPSYGVDVALQRPLIATFGMDQTVRIWNFVDRQCVLAKQLEEDVFCLALHPSGLSVVLGFRDKLRLFHVLADDLLLVREFHMPGCKQVSFSHSGHLFVASNATTSQVFNAYTSTTVGTLRGHTAAVRSASWAANDQRLVTVGLDGAAYEWKMDSYARDQSTENVVKSVQYSCVAYGRPGGPPFYVTAGRDKICRLRHMINGACEHEIKIDGCQITALALVDHNKTLLAATDEGAVRVYPWFGNKHPGEWSGEKPGRFEELRLHQGAITSMCVSPDQSFLFTTGEDGSVFTCDIRTEAERSAPPRSSGERWAFGPDACLVNREDWREVVGSVDDLKGQIESLQRRMEYQSMVQENKRKEQVAAAEAETEAVKRSAEKSIDDVKEATERLKEDHARQLRLLKDAQLKTSAHVEAEHAAALEKAAERLARAQGELEEERAAAVRAIEGGRARAAQDIAALKEDLDAEKARARAQVEDARRLAEEARREAEERRKQLDEEFEIVANRNDLRRDEQRIEAERKESELRARTSIVRRDLDGALLAKRIAQDELAKREEDLASARAQLQDAAAKHQSLLAVLAEREQSLHTMEQTLHRIRSANKDLEVHKYLADHKLRDAHLSVAPREAELARLKEELEARDEELQKSVLEQDNQRVAIRDQVERLAGLKKEAAALHATVKARESVIAHFEHDLSMAMTEADPEAKERRLRALYEKHCGHKKDGDDDVSPEAIAEMRRQRTYLEHTSKYQQKGAESAEKRYARAMRKARDENQLLLSENMDLRQDKKALAHQLQTLEEKIKLHPQLFNPHESPRSHTEPSSKPSLTPRVGSARVPRFTPAALAAAIAVREGLGSASSTSRSGRVVKGSVSRSLVYNNAVDELEDDNYTGLSARSSGGSSRPATSREGVIEAQRKEIARLREKLKSAHRGSLTESEIVEDEENGGAPSSLELEGAEASAKEGSVIRTGAQTAREWTPAEGDGRRKSFRAVGLQPELLIPLLDIKVVASGGVNSGVQTARPSTSRLPSRKPGDSVLDGNTEGGVRVSRKLAIGGGFLTSRRPSNSTQAQHGDGLVGKAATERRKSMPDIKRFL